MTALSPRITPWVFVVRAGADGADELYNLDNGIALLGFREYPSLEAAKDYNAVFAILRGATPDLKPRALGNFAGQLWTFALSMQVGDLVVLPRKLTSQVAIGRVSGPYRYQSISGEYRHTRAVEWLRPDVARSVFGQDLLNSFGALMTICRVSRNDAETRVAAVLAGKPDPGYQPGPDILPKLAPAAPSVSDAVAEAVPDIGPSLDLAQADHDEIVAHIQTRFHGHAMARLVDAVLTADGWVTRLSPPGPDGGVDIFAGRGSLGLDQPRLCVQVKSQASPVDVTVYRTLLGSMQTFKAEQGLLVAWGGFNRAVLSEARQGYFSVRLWDARDLVEAIYRTYDRLPPEIQAELALKRVWMLVREDAEA